MNLNFIFVGGAKTSWARAVEKEYCKRLAPWQARIVSIKKGTGQNAKAQEAKRIRGVLTPDSLLIVLSEEGKLYSSIAFSRQLEKWLQSPPVALVVGGADGLEQKLLAQADAKLSLSSLTLAHDLARVMLMEQCYRAWSIASGHPYHRS